MTELELRLAELGDALDLDESGLVDGVLARLVDPPGDIRVGATDDARPRPPATRAARLGAAAAVLVAIAAALLAVPSSRRAIADWLGLDGVKIERRPELSVPRAAPSVDRRPSPIGGTVVVAGDIPVLVDEIAVGELDGRLDEALLSKTLAATTGLEQVTVAGNPGLWIDGQPHVVSYRSDGGTTELERFAGNTLLWQDGDVIRRVEGFPTLDAALAFAVTID